MLTMSVPAQQKPSAKRTGKRITFFSDPTGAMKETGQHPEGAYYIQGGGEPGKTEAPSGVAANPEAHRVYLNSVIFSPDKGDQNRGHYQQTLPMKWAQQESGQPQPRAATWTPVGNWGPNFANYLSDSRSHTAFIKQTQESGDRQAARPDPTAGLYRDAVKARGLDWDQRAFQAPLKPGALNPQPNSASHPVGSSVLQPFQLAFGQPRQHLPAYFQSFQGNARLPNPPNYSVQAKLPQQAPQLQRQHLIQQQLQQQQQQIILQQQLQMQHQQLQQQSQQALDYYPSNAHSHPQFVHGQAPSQIQEPLIQDITPEPQSFDPPSLPSLLPDPSSEAGNLRRSRPLSKEGGAPSDGDPFPGEPGPQNGTRGGDDDILAAPAGVIQSAPRRRRRVSQEVNLETLAQKASEMETLPSQDIKEPHRPWGPSQPGGPSMNRPRDDSLLPLVIPVSVPVHRLDLSSCVESAAAPASNWPPPRPDPPEIAGAERNPSVIVTRRRSLRNSLTEGSEQNGEGKKLKRRPRPEPLFIPPPKLGATMAPPAIYSSVTPYQSHLRSPVRMADNPLAVPPYTPPPILSPVREGSGLYFSTFLSAAPSATPKSATRSLLSTSSCDMTPPVLSAVGEPTPVSIEPRINMGSQYQAAVPDLRPRSLVELDTHGAELVWAPLTQLEDKPEYHIRVKDLMRLACSSALCGGGSNQELAHHCLHQCHGDIMASLSLLMLSNPVLPKSRSSDYHYAGSDKWSAVERRQFNKGMATYKKDFFMVQKQVSTKTVAQCVEFYYSYKKHIKVGRNGALIYGEAALTDGGTTEAEETNQNKASHELQQQEEDSRKWEGSADRKQDVGPDRVALALPSAQNPTTVLIMKAQEDVVARDGPPPPPPHVVGPPHRTSPPTGNKGAAGGPEGEFPCKKCGRVFSKVKSRSAHMKSHAEQEKKAAAQRQKEAEERARAAQAAAQAQAAAFMAARQQNGTRQAGGDSEDDGDDPSNSEDDDAADWQ